MPSKDVYKLTLTLGNDVYTGKGATPLEAIETLTFPFAVKVTKGTLVFDKNGAKKEIMLMPIQIKRLSMKLSRLFILKQFNFGLK